MAKNPTVRKANGTGNVVLTKAVDEMSSSLNMVSETISELKKGLEILKDEPGQSEIPVLGDGGTLKRDVEELKSKI